jgi:hypothetical protein
MIPPALTAHDAEHEQAQAERLAGQLLTHYVHQLGHAERQRILSRAFWEAGRAGAYAEIAERLHASRDTPRGNKR